MPEVVVALVFLCCYFLFFAGAATLFGAGSLSSLSFAASSLDAIELFVTSFFL